jgi:predicted CXXCH cytochrome family protein
MTSLDYSRITLVNLVLILLISHYLSVNAYSFTSSKEYLSHIKGSSSCTTEQCHAEFTDREGKYLHDPLVSGKCSACHSAEAYPNKYGLEKNQVITCNKCHKSMENEIQSSKYLHGPIKNGDCTSCHDPHSSTWPFFLRQSYNELCLSCHKRERLYTGAFLHKPVKDGNCGICHDPHASNFKYRLTDIGVNLCVVCHEDMVTGMTQKYIHTPIIKSGCSGCHNSHSGNNKLRLIADAEKLCFTCHEEKSNEVNQDKFKHKPVFEGKCIACHSPHYSEIKDLLLDEIDDLCYKCHEENGVWKERRFKHGPVVQGNCTACHNPHGSDYAFTLRMPFPHNFYSEYAKGKYGLCFLCHKEALATVMKTTRITNFRNGEDNLHWLHVNQKKGRTCRACHDVHASDQEGRIRDAFPFGQVQIELEYYKTETGGRCMVGCHKERSYDRFDKIEYFK